MNPSNTPSAAPSSRPTGPSTSTVKSTTSDDGTTAPNRAVGTREGCSQGPINLFEPPVSNSRGTPARQYEPPVRGTTLMHCAEKCVSAAACAAFAFSRVTGGCRVYTKGDQSMVDAAPQFEIEYYRKMTSKCVHTATPDLVNKNPAVVETTSSEPLPTTSTSFQVPETTTSAVVSDGTSSILVPDTTTSSLARDSTTSIEAVEITTSGVVPDSTSSILVPDTTISLVPVSDTTSTSTLEPTTSSSSTTTMPRCPGTESPCRCKPEAVAMLAFDPSFGCRCICVRHSHYDAMVSSLELERDYYHWDIHRDLGFIMTDAMGKEFCDIRSSRPSRDTAAGRNLVLCEIRNGRMVTMGRATTPWARTTASRPRRTTAAPTTRLTRPVTTATSSTPAPRTRPAVISSRVAPQTRATSDSASAPEVYDKIEPECTDTVEASMQPTFQCRPGASRVLKFSPELGICRFACVLLL